MSIASHPIKVVARLTGLSAYVIRIWEQRYGAVKPGRTGTNRRLYSDQQVERLKLLREVTQAGHNIGLIARWPTEKLRKQAAESASTAPRSHRTATVAPPLSDAITAECVAAMKTLDAKAFDDALKRGAMALGTMGLLQRVVSPLTQIIGELWIDGSVTVAHEHLATSVLRTFLLNAARPFGENKHSPRLVVATPAGQLHELGALLVGALATHLDWQIIYLGASLPATEIAGAARQSRARAVALSLVYPEDDSRMETELKLLRELLPAAVAILAGGRAMPAYHDTLHQIGAVPTGDLSDLVAKLEALRKPIKKTPGSKRMAG
jgi:DNA-binding transcriptional MerR regulator/methylmalonyl-CoA mutase cobalamin-binding subunit